VTRVFRYILVNDYGMAPCVDRGWISLATCKPKIRASAKVGDWVAGFVPSPAPRGLVVWAGRVSRRLEVGDYEREFRGRADAVYQLKDDGTFERLRPDYHPEPDNMRKDLSAPVLVFDPSASWYFGARPLILPDDLMFLAAGGRGHRVNGATETDVEAFGTWLQQVSPPMIGKNPRARSVSARKC
jgi:hypothetical protein